MLRSMRLTGPFALIFLVVTQASGCGNGAVDVNWPAGTAAIVQDRGAPRVLAVVPIDQRESVKRRSLSITNKTPVIIVDDPAYRALSPGSANSTRPQSPVRVRLTEGAGQGVELFIRRQDLAPQPEPDRAWLAYMPVFLLVFIATAAVLSTIETLALALRNRRRVTGASSHMIPTRQLRHTGWQGNREAEHWSAGTMIATSGTPWSRR